MSLRQDCGVDLGHGTIAAGVGSHAITLACKELILQLSRLFHPFPVRDGQANSKSFEDDT